MNNIPELVLKSLCYYDVRNPDTCLSLDDLTEEEKAVPQIEGVDFAEKDCFCDNCFYGRTKLAMEYIKNIILK